MITEHKLAVILSKLDEHPNPKYHLEQYSISPGIAANILFTAKDDIKDKIVYDLGCGTGRFAIGSALLGAKEVFGVDIDEEALDVAKENMKWVENKTGVKIGKKIKWVEHDVTTLHAKANTVVQFPPFSVRKGLDMKFFDKALEIASVVYSVHRGTSGIISELKKICKKHGATIKNVERFKYKLPWSEDDKTKYDIFLVVAKR
jgi:putative methylase